MPAKPIQTLAIATGLAVAGCANSTPNAREAAMPSEQAGDLPPGYVRDVYTGKPIKAPEPVKQWPLKFDSHTFGLVTYDVYGVNVDYAGVLHEDDPDELQRSSASYGPNYQRNWGNGHIGIRNFPRPAKVSWRSKDGEAHQAEIDFGEIFRDELVRHNVRREDMADVPNGKYQNDPSIILEVNDRTLRVWMRAHVPTKKLQKPGNKYSDFRSDVVLVETYTY